MNLEIILNKSQLANASKEYVAATIIHEAFHAYLKYSQTIVNDHLDMARNYISVMTANLISMFPNIDPNDAQALSWGGLETGIKKNIFPVRSFRYGIIKFGYFI